MQNTIINIAEMKELFEEFYKENKMKFTKKEFEKFLNFLEIDFYDWVNENLGQFKSQKI